MNYKDNMLVDLPFQKAIKTVLDHEGGLTDNPHDPGGITNYGISLRFLKSLPLKDGDVNGDGRIDADDIRALTPDYVKYLYYKYFWIEYSYNIIALSSPDIGTKIFDLAVNMGPARANKLFQTALNEVGGFGLLVDGAIGKKTISAFSIISSNYHYNLLMMIRSLAASYYIDLVRRRPSLGVFLNGWLKRANS